jgi:hypothetical protein
MASHSPTRLQQQLNWYLSLLVIGLIVIVPPLLCGLFYLSQVPEVNWIRADGLTYDRIWLHRERRPVGLGYQSQRRVAEYNPTKVCLENRLRFWLWAKSPLAQPAVTRQTALFVDNRWQPTGQRCP